MSVPTTVEAPPEGLTRNCTCAIVAPLPGLAVAVRPTLLPTVTTEPTAGAVSDTVGWELAALTVTALDVADCVVESVTVAVSVKTPAEGGVHATV